jgi:hypothetical protein
VLRGRYGDTSGRPYIAGRVVLPRLDLTVDVSFCLDTGADRTMLMPSDYLRVALDVTALRDAVETIGVGGASLAYREPALVAFASRDQVFVTGSSLKSRAMLLTSPTSRPSSVEIS